jgi:hypothetical protein
MSPPPKTKSSERPVAARKPKAAAVALSPPPDSHYGEGAASAWETWNQLEHHRARTRVDADSALAPPRKPKSS